MLRPPQFRVPTTIFKTRPQNIMVISNVIVIYLFLHVLVDGQQRSSAGPPSGVEFGPSGRDLLA